MVAKKKKVEEEFEFIPPEFDEKEYIMKDLADSKIVILTTVIGILVGALAATATVYVSPFLGFLIIVVMLFVIFRFIYRALHVNLANFKRSDYLYKGGTYLITAIALWILLLNPPFAVVTPPAIKGVPSLYELSGTATWIKVPLNLTSPPVVSPGTMNLTAQVVYTLGVTVTLNVYNGTGTEKIMMKQVSQYEFRAIFTVSHGTYTLYISARSGLSPAVVSPKYSISVT